MIKTSHYIQILECAARSLAKAQPTDEQIQGLDLLRQEHLLLQNQLDEYMVYPHKDLSMARDITKSIKIICDRLFISPFFFVKDSTEWKCRNFAQYYLKYTNEFNNPIGIDVTDLIVFRKKDYKKLRAIEFLDI
jgi:hypothetical protein